MIAFLFVTLKIPLIIIHLVLTQTFRETNIYYRLIRPRTYTQVRDVSFLESFEDVLHE